MRDYRIKPAPGYETHVANNLGLGREDGKSMTMSELQAYLRSYTCKPDTEIKDIYIPSREEGREIMLRLIIPGGLPEKAPVIMDIHGGGWVSGDVGIDNYRNVSLAEGTPCIVASVEYRLATKERTFPEPLNDCIDAFDWLAEHAEEIGGDPERLGLHGTSSGGNLAAGLVLWNADHGKRVPALTVLNCACLSMDPSPSKMLLGNPAGAGHVYADYPECIYTGTTDSRSVSKYAMPAYATDLSNLPPFAIVIAEYDSLWYEAMDFAKRLMLSSVPCELICAPRVSHAFCGVDAPLTHWVVRGICGSFRREFGMETVEY